MNAIYEAIIEIAEELAANGETRTFDELAEMLDDFDFDDDDEEDDDEDDDDGFYGGRAMARRVAAAYRYAYDTGRPDEAEMIAQSFTDRNGDFPYELYE